MKYKALISLFLFFIANSMLFNLVFSQEYISKICERGVAIYQNGTTCSDLIYISLEESKKEGPQTYSTIIAIALILFLTGIFLFIYKKFFQK